MLDYGERLEHVRTRATGNVSFFASYFASKGFNSNSLYGEACHQMFMLQIKEQIQILNGNNNFLE